MAHGVTLYWLLLLIYTASSESVVVQLNSDKLKTGATALIQCLSSYDGKIAPPKLEWSFNNQPLLPKSGSRYHITPDLSQILIRGVLKDDEGVYECSAKLSGGTVQRSQARLAVIERPELTKQTDVRALLGTTVTLSCIGTGFTDVSWSRNGKTLHTDFRYGISGSKGEHLEIAHVETNDRGTYTCTASNVYYSEVASISVTVQYSPVVTENPKNSSVGIGDYITMGCKFDSVPRARVFWLKDGDVVNVNDTRYVYRKDEASTQLSIPYAASSDTGAYQCLIKNSIGRKASQEAYVFVKPHVVYTLEPKKVIFVAGKNETLECGAIGGKNYVWTKSNVLLFSTSRVRTKRKDALLSFTNVQFEDAGQYRCLVDGTSQLDSSIQQEMYVSVEGPPDSPVLTLLHIGLFDLENRNRQEHILALLNWTLLFDGNSSITGFNVFWGGPKTFYSETKPPNCHSTTLRIPVTTDDHFYRMTFYVEAVNQHGIGKSNTETAVISKPKEKILPTLNSLFPSSPQLTKKGPDRSLTLVSIIVPILAVLIVSAFVLIRSKLCLCGKSNSSESKA